MSKRKRNTSNNTSSEEPDAKRIKIHQSVINVSSKLFTNECDAEYFRQTYEAISTSTITRSQNTPTDIIKNIAEFASGIFMKCDNFSHCNNRILPSLGDVDLMEHGIYKINWNKIYEDSAETHISQLDVVNDKAKEYVKQFGYFFVNWFASVLGTDEDKYFCSDCINQRGGSNGLKECEACLFGSEYRLIIWNDTPEEQECACGHSAIYCDDCNAHESRYCQICKETKCHIDDNTKWRCDDMIQCHQQFDCDECEQTICSLHMSLDEIKIKCDIPGCMYWDICADCIIPIYCVGCGDHKSTTHKSCHQYETTAYTKCSNTECQYNNWKNGPLYQLWFGKKS